MFNKSQRSMKIGNTHSSREDLRRHDRMDLSTAAICFASTGDPQNWPCLESAGQVDTALGKGPGLLFLFGDVHQVRLASLASDQPAALTEK